MPNKTNPNPFKVKNSHDNVFKAHFRNKPVMKAFLNSSMPTKLKSKVDLATLQLENSSFVDPRLQDTESDLVYSLKIAGDGGYLYVLIECESTRRRAEHLPLRLFQYNVRLMCQHIEQGRGTKFPTILNLVLYTDTKPYKGEMRLIDCFEQPKLFYQMMESELLVQLNSKSMERILKDKEAALVQLLLKYGKARELAKLITENPEMMQKLVAESPCQVATLRYIVEREGWWPEEVLEKFPNLAEEIKQEFMSGIQKVVQKGRHELIQGMFTAGVPLALIAQGAKLPESEIKEILGIDGKDEFMTVTQIAEYSNHVQTKTSATAVSKKKKKA